MSLTVPLSAPSTALLCLLPPYVCSETVFSAARGAAHGVPLCGILRVFSWAQHHLCVCEGLAVGHIMGRQAELLAMGELNTGAGLEGDEAKGWELDLGLETVTGHAACPLSPSPAVP